MTLVLVFVLTFASIFIVQADWGKLVKEKWFKKSNPKTKTNYD